MSTTQWPVGQSFVTVTVEDEVLIWGGTQCYGKKYYHISEEIYFYKPSTNLWRKISASGDIPTHPVGCAYTVYQGLLFIFGGRSRKESKWSNDMHTLNMKTGVFRLLPVTGKRPSPRETLEGWTYQNKLYFFAGYDKHRGENQLEPPSKFSSADNLLFSFDPESNNFSSIETSGPRPDPRSGYAMAKINDHVVIHGGYKAKRSYYADIFFLNMENFTWSQQRGNGESVYGHSFTQISKDHILLVGGYSKKVWVLDVANVSWKEESELPADVVGKYVYYHRSVAIRQNNGISVFCLGGWTSKSRYLSQMIVYDIV